MKKTGSKTRTVITTVTLACILVTSILFLNHTRPLPVRCRFYGEMTDELKDSELFEDMQSGRSFCFIGDSLTRGTETYGTPWYKHLKPYINGDVTELSHGDWTTLDVINNLSEAPTADIYVIAVGINDVLNIYGNRGANTPEEYTENCQKIVDTLRTDNTDAKFYFITPWPLTDDEEGYYVIRDNFAEVLKEWCNGDDIICIDPYPVISSVLEADGRSEYLIDHVHPNATRGIGLYSYAVLYAEHQRRADGQTA